MKNTFTKLLLFFLPATFCMQAQNVGINSGGSTPNSSAVLDLNTGNTFTSPNGKGLLVPNVALTGTNDATTVTSPATSLLVYNTATAGAGSTAVTPGYYYWNGTKWVAMGGAGGLDWSLTGNAGTTAGTNFIGTTDAVDWVVKTNNTERMRALSAGDISWGSTQNNRLQLDQGGSIELGANNGAANTAGNLPYIDFHFGSGAVEDYNARLINSAASRLDFNTLAGGTAMTVNSNSVGIGTTAPSYYFHTTNNVATPGAVALVNNGSSGDGLRAYSASAAGYAAFWGNNTSSNAGSGYGITTSVGAIEGQISSAGNYAFAVIGQVGGGTGRRIGGVTGNGPYVGQWAALGYQTSGNVSWAVYYSNNATTGGSTTGGGRVASPDSRILSGMGVGGFAELLGAGLRGGKYGVYAEGERYGMYTNGKTFATDIITQLNSSDDKTGKFATYVPSSTNVDVYTHGSTRMENGKAFIAFPENFKKLASEKETPCITVTPMGKSNGIYIEHITKDGFFIAENNNGTSDVQVSWIAIGTRKGYEDPSLPAELLSEEYDSNMRSVINDENSADPGKAMWWNGTELKFGSLDNSGRTLNPAKNSSSKNLSAEK